MTPPDSDINNAPDYIKQYVARPTQNGVAELLLGGNWCGHGEELYRVYDIVENGNSIFKVQLPDTETEPILPTAIKVTSLTSQKQFFIYDARQHPASWNAFADNAKKESKFLDTYCCDKCNGVYFKISTGFEVPVDSDSSNDTTWFVLATECDQCGDRTIIFEGETA